MRFLNWIAIEEVVALTIIAQMKSGVLIRRRVFNAFREVNLQSIYNGEQFKPPFCQFVLIKCLVNVVKCEMLKKAIPMLNNATAMQC